MERGDVELPPAPPGGHSSWTLDMGPETQPPSHLPPVHRLTPERRRRLGLPEGVDLRNTDV